jgi:hypothetical protein
MGIWVAAVPIPKLKNSKLEDSKVRNSTSTYLVEGERLELECEAIAYPAATVRWTRTNLNSNLETDIGADSDPRVTVGNSKRQINGSLTFENMQTDDYMFYNCVAENEIGSNFTRTLVRVKGTYVIYTVRDGKLIVAYNQPTLCQQVRSYLSYLAAYR